MSIKSFLVKERVSFLKIILFLSNEVIKLFTKTLRGLVNFYMLGEPKIQMRAKTDNRNISHIACHHTRNKVIVICQYINSISS